MSNIYDYKIEELDVNDSNFLERILYEAIHVKAGDIKPDKNIIHKPELIKYITDWREELEYGLVAVDLVENKKIGAVWLKLFTKDNGGYGYVSEEIPELSMAILPDYRGFGVGTELLKKLIDESKFNRISLSVDSDNEAVNLYKKFGFEEYKKEGSSVTMLINLD